MRRKGVSTGHVTAQSQLTTAWFKLNRANFRNVNLSYSTAHVEFLREIQDFVGLPTREFQREIQGICWGDKSEIPREIQA